MKMSGIGKYPFISTSDSLLDFGVVLLDKGRVEREFELRNQSLVRASFEVVPMENDHEQLFEFHPSSGVIQAERSITVKVIYTPLASRAFTLDRFQIRTPGGNSSK